MTDSAISIKGIRDGLLISINHYGDWQAVTHELTAQIVAQSEFFRGARVALDVGEREIRHEVLRELTEQLTALDVVLWAIVSNSPATNRAALRLHLETEVHDSPLVEEEELHPFDADVFGSDGVLVRGTLRSGRQVRHTGHVVIIGDVNPGAQIIAGGDVVVWGRLRGTVHAGARGDENMVVCALDLVPTQLRIAQHIAISPEDKHRKPRPEIAVVKSGQIVAEEWVP